MKKFINHFFYLKIIILVLSNLLIGLKYKFGLKNTLSGSRHLNKSLDFSINYINKVFNDYRIYGDLNFNNIHNIAEIGPGDNYGVAILFKCKGVNKIDLIDKFFSSKKSNDQNKIYDKLIKDNHIENNDNKIKLIEKLEKSINLNLGTSAEDYFKKKSNKYDLIISRAVMEHLSSPITALEDMINSTSKNGKILHRVDLRDHGMFSENFYELKFLEIPLLLYKLMTKHSGRPNRILLEDYINFLKSNNKSLKFTYKIYVTRIVGVKEEIQPHILHQNFETEKFINSKEIVMNNLSKFTSEIKKHNIANLMISGIFIVINKK
tara:strand:- start:138 stop:1100 length:963 start_codon:yes stop_codon:yes gene_type:complete